MIIEPGGLAAPASVTSLETPIEKGVNRTHEWEARGERKARVEARNRHRAEAKTEAK